MQNVSASLKVSSKRSKYAKSNISSAVVPHTPEVTIQAPTPAKRESKTDENVVKKPTAKAKAKRLNYAKKTWASTPVDDIINNNPERFGKVMPLQFDPNFMGQNMPIMGSSNRRSSPMGKFYNNLIHLILIGIKMMPPAMNLVMQNPMANMMPSMNYQMQNMALNNQNMPLSNQNIALSNQNMAMANQAMSLSNQNQFFQNLNNSNRPMTMSMSQTEQLSQMIPSQLMTQPSNSSIPIETSTFTSPPNPSDKPQINSTTQNILDIVPPNMMPNNSKMQVATKTPGQTKVTPTFNPMNMVDMTRTFLSSMKEISNE